MIRGGKDFYNVTVVSHPNYSLPQELCLSFNCFTKTISKGNSTPAGPAIDQVVSEFATLLSVFARQPLGLLGLRRLNNKPVSETHHYQAPPRPKYASRPPAFGINSPDFLTLIEGLANAPASEVDAMLGAAKFYQAGLSLVGFDPSVAYVCLVSAVECLAAHHYSELQFGFDEIEKFRKVGTLLGDIAGHSDYQLLVSDIKRELIRSERFIRRKFVRFIEEFLPDEFWVIPDELYKYASVFPLIDRDRLGTSLRMLYDARSTFVHSGVPFPPYVEFGLRDRHPPVVALELGAVHGKEKYLPPLSWFERIAHLAMVEYMRRSFAPALVQAQADLLALNELVFQTIGRFQEDVRESLKELVHRTAKFIGYSVLNPHFSNKDWAASGDVVQTLFDAGIIGGDTEFTLGSSWIKDRVVGEIVGEYFFGRAQNPFRGNELLLPRESAIGSGR